MNFASMADGPRGPADLVKANEELETQLFTKSGEVANLRERLAKFERDLTELRAQNHSLRQQVPSARTSSAAGPNGTVVAARDAARVRELEREIAQTRTKLEFRENDHQKNLQELADLEKSNAEKDRMLQEQSRQRDVVGRELQQLKDRAQQQQQQQLELQRELETLRARERERRDWERERDQHQQSEQGERERNAGQKRERSAASELGHGTTGEGKTNWAFDGCRNREAAFPSRSDKGGCAGLRSTEEVLTKAGGPCATERSLEGGEKMGDCKEVEVAPAGTPADHGGWRVEENGGGAGVWDVERMERSAVLTNLSAERLRIVNALLSAWGTGEGRMPHAEGKALLGGEWAGKLCSDYGDAGNFAAAVVQRAMAGKNSGAIITGRQSGFGVWESLGSFLKGASSIQEVLNSLQSIATENMLAWLHCKTGRTTLSMGTSVLLQRSAMQIETHIPALASLLAMSETCRNCVLEEAFRELDDAKNADEDGLAGPTGEDMLDADMSGRRRAGRGGHEGRAGGLAMKGSGGGTLTMMTSTIHMSVSGSNGNQRSADTKCLFLLLLQFTHAWIDALFKDKKFSESQTIVHVLEIVRLLLEQCSAERLPQIAMSLDLNTSYSGGLGQSLVTLLESESTSLRIKSSCLAVLSTMVSCAELSDALCPEIEDDEDLDDLSCSIPLLEAVMHVLNDTVQIVAPPSNEELLASEEEEALHLERSRVCHAILRLLAQLCTYKDIDWVQLLLRRSGSQAIRLNYPRLQVYVGNIIVHQVSRISRPQPTPGIHPFSAAAVPDDQGMGSVKAQEQLLREAVSLLWIFVLASHQVEGARVQEFWGAGVWMPLLAALRRLESGSVLSELSDLTKVCERMAALLQADCMPDDGEGLGVHETQWGTSEAGTLTMHGASIGLI